MAIDDYHAARLARDDAASEVKALTARLNAVVKQLTLDPDSLIGRPIRHPVRDDERQEYSIDLDDMTQEQISLAEMPEPAAIKGALIKLRNAEVTLKHAFDGLTPVEKSYVSPKPDTSRRR